MIYPKRHDLQVDRTGEHLGALSVLQECRNWHWQSKLSEVVRGHCSPRSTEDSYVEVLAKAATLVSLVVGKDGYSEYDSQV